MTGEEEVGFDLFTLTFDSSPIKGEGDWLVLWFMSFRAMSWFCSPFR